MIAYFLSLFPCWSETFILHEILTLRRRGVPIKIFSLRPPSERLVQDAARPLLGEVVYPRGPRFMFDVAAGVLRHPLRTVRVLLQAVREAQALGLRESMKAAYTVFAAAGFARRLRSLRVAHVHAHWATYPALAARAIKALSGTRYTVTTHAHDIFLPNPYLMTNLGEAERVITISEYNRRHLIGQGIEASKIRVVPCGVDLARFSGLRPNSAAGRSLLAVGRLEAIKGFSCLIEACAELRARGVAFTCDIVGDGTLREALERQVQDLGLGPLVRLRGALPQDAVRAALAEADVFVLPSVRTALGDQDGIPVALMEAMAAGIPVLTTTVSGIPELVTHEVSGLLVEPGDAIALADGIERLLADHALREKLGTAGVVAARSRHDVAGTAAQVHSVFIEAMRGA